MPSMTAAFDEAFAPLPDRKIAALDALLSAVESVNVIHGCAEIRVGDESYTVTPQFCAACGADASQDCPHKAIVRGAIQYADELRERERMQDYAEAQSYGHAVGVGAG